MKFDIDLTKVPTIKPLPDGIYILRILSAELKKSKAQKDKLMWTAEVMKPEEAKKITTKFWFDTSLSEGALFHLRDLFEACGKLKPGGFDPVALYGVQVGARIISGIWEGTERSQVKEWIKLSETRPKFEKPLVVVHESPKTGEQSVPPSQSPAAL